MKNINTNKLFGALVMATLITGCVALAQNDAGANANINNSATVEAGGPPRGQPPRPGGFLRNFFGSMRNDGRDWQEGQRDGSTTQGMATPTPWKDFGRNIKGGMQNGMNQLRDDMHGKMATLTDAQLTTISAKLGITVDAIKAKLATGTNLRDIIKDKISMDEMRSLFPNLPPMFGRMGSGTNATGTSMMGDNHDASRPPEPRGFFNQLRMKFFGGDANVDASTTGNMNDGMRGFFKKLFNF